MKSIARDIGFGIRSLVGLAGAALIVFVFASTPSTFADCPVPCNFPSVEILGTSIGNDNVYLDGTANIYLRWRYHSPCVCTNNCGGPGLFAASIVVDGKVGPRIDAGLPDAEAEGNYPISGAAAPALFASGCMHTVQILATIYSAEDGGCSSSMTHGFLSNPITVWVKDQGISLPATLANCTDTPECQESSGGSPQPIKPTVGLPVNIATGRMSHDMLDLRVDGPMPIEFRRHYDTIIRHYSATGQAELVDEGMGYGWRHNGMIRLDVSDPLRRVLVDKGGRRIFFSCASAAGNTCSGAWFPNITEHLEIIQGSNPPWQVRDKHKTSYDFDGDGTLVGVHDRNGNSLTYSYDSNNNLNTITDSLGRSITLAYSQDPGSHRLQSVTAGNRTVSYTYTGDELTRVDFPDNSYVIYEYWGAPNAHFMKSATMWDTSTPAQGQQPKSQLLEAHEYQACCDGRVHSTHSADGNGSYVIEYNGYPASDTTVTNGRGIPTTTSFDVAMGVATKRVGGPGCAACDGRGDETSKVYDEYRNVTDETEGDPVNGDGVTAHMTYDTHGNMLTRTEALGTDEARETIVTYNETFSLPETISVPSLGTGDCAKDNPYKIVRRTYDPDSGDLMTEETTGCNGDDAVDVTTAYTYDARGRVLTIDGPRTDVEDVTTNEYYVDVDPSHTIPENDLGRLHTVRAVVNGIPHVTTYEDYDYFGNPQTVKDPNNVKTTYTYDTRDHVTQQRIQANANATSLDDIVTQYHYNGFGNLDFVRLPNCVASTSGCEFSSMYVYDGVNRLKEVHDASGNKVIYTYDAEGNRLREEYRDSASTIQKFTNFAYDDFNRLQYTWFQDNPSPPNTGANFYQNTYRDDGLQENERDPQAHVKTFEYDKLKRLVATREQVGMDTLTTSYAYDSQDNVIQVTDPGGAVTSYTYGDLGWRLSTDSPDTGHSSYEYDSAGNVHSSTDARGIKAVHTYDELNRLTTVTYPDTTLNVTTSYDSGPFGIGRRTGMADVSGSTSYSYDFRGLLTSEVKDIKDWSYETQYAHDLSGNLKRIQYPASNTAARQGEVDYDYNSADRVSLVKTPINGDIVDVAEDLLYEPFGPATRIDLHNGLVDQRTFDTKYQLATWTLGNSSGGDRLSYTYGFNPDGNVTSRVDNNAHTNDRSFDYDAIHRLTMATGPAWPTSNLCGGQTYTYDGNGNRLCQWESGMATDHTYALHTNRLASSTNGVSSIFYSYDAIGNTTWDGVHTYEYDDAGRLSTVDYGATATYVYDGDGRRVQKTTADETTYYFYDPAGQLLTEMTPARIDGTGEGKDYVYVNGAPLARVDWTVSASLDGCPPGLGNGDCEPTVVAGAALYYYHTDHLGTPIAMTAGDASFAWRAEYLPFGGDTPTGTAVNNLRFPGQYFDLETGLHQNWFRDYQPKTGRYIESDPIGLRGGTNTNVYGTGNPINRIDPQGLEAQCPVTAGPDCKKVKQRCLDECSDRFIGIGDGGWAFAKCVTKCMADAGCGPGHDPLRRPRPVTLTPPPLLPLPLPLVPPEPAPRPLPWPPLLPVVPRLVPVLPMLPIVSPCILMPELCQTSPSPS